ncbi:hypothetical protein EMIT0P265_80248 [Pseudomonas zeae]
MGIINPIYVNEHAPEQSPFVSRKLRRLSAILWERACSRMRCVIQRRCWLNGRLREQARSHRGYAA